ncbi:MAG: Gfo/Idh/MocA family oxidoreductase [Syntrophorhabdaceae bacterium]|nr:Gfo/Idh/MocA family oxidoreductase [Syntrophorhabdaceae bacterium]
MPINISLIGAGYMGSIHLEKLLTLDGVQVSGIVDIDNGIGKCISDRHKIPFFCDYRDIVSISDGIVIASPTETHYEIARYCLEKGIHVFIEKPMAMNVKEAVYLIDLTRDKGLVLQIGHLERFNPAFKKAEEFIENPIIIEARRTGPYTGRSTDIDLVSDLMIHDIDLLLCILKARVRSVIKAYGMPLINDKEDVVTATLEFENGCIATLHVNRVSAGKERVLTVFEKDRALYIDLLNGRLTVKTKKQERDFETHDYEAGKIDSVREELKEFVDSIQGKTRPTVDGASGLRALEIVGLIRTSLER